MKILSLLIFLFFIEFHSFSQKKKEEEIFTAVEQQAEFPGGMGAFGKYLQKNLKWQGDEKERLPTKIYVQFVVEKDGSTNNIEFLTKSTPKEIKDQFIKMIKNVKWIPGKQGGKTVRSRFTIPMNLEGASE